MLASRPPPSPLRRYSDHTPQLRIRLPSRGESRDLHPRKKKKRFMSTDRRHANAAKPPPLPTPAFYGTDNSEDGQGLAAVDAIDLLPEQIRYIIRLVQCPRCSLPLDEPTTLPCGKTLCKTCLPETYRRANISYPGTAGRTRGFECPFEDCKKDHALGDCAADVVLCKAITLIKEELVKARKSAARASQDVRITTEDEWSAAGISSLRDREMTSSPLSGGRLLATYAMAESGQLDYHTDVKYSRTAATDPTNHHSNVDTSVVKQVEASIRGEMDCQVCYALLYDPLTTACGHTYCRHCLRRVFDHGVNCPVCRRTLFVEPQLERQSVPSNELLSDIIDMFWSDALAARKTIVATEEGRADGANLPIFVCTLSFPTMPTFLHIFEPRYRLMMRRALEADRLFGMVLYRRPRRSGEDAFEEVGTVLRILNVEFLPDGRSLIETKGVSRFRVIRHEMLDGYLTAEIEKITDISIAEEEALEARETRSRVHTVEDITPQEQASRSSSGENTPMSSSSDTMPDTGAPAAAVVQTIVPTQISDLDSMSTRELMDFATTFVARMREQSVDWLANRMLVIYGECPDDPALFAWWFASILPVKDEEKYRLLSTHSVRERLKICCGWILEWEER